MNMKKKKYIPILINLTPKQHTYMKKLAFKSKTSVGKMLRNDVEMRMAVK